MRTQGGQGNTYRFDCEVVSLAQSIFRVTTGLNEATKGERATPSIHREQMRTANARHEDYSSKSCFCPKHIRTLTNIHRFYPLATTTPTTFLPRLVLGLFGFAHSGAGGADIVNQDNFFAFDCFMFSCFKTSDNIGQSFFSVFYLHLRLGVKFFK